MISSRYYVPEGRSVGKPSGGLYRSGQDVPAADIEAMGAEKVAHYVCLGRLAERSRQEPSSRPAPEGRKGKVSPGKWRVDPDLLKGKSLDELNVMVLEIDGSMKPFDTVEEARAQLSIDLRA